MGNHTYPTHFYKGKSRVKKPANQEAFKKCIKAMKGQCTNAVECMIIELEKRFPNHDLMNTLGIVFPKFLLQENADIDFPMHYALIKRHFGDLKCTTILGGEKGNAKAVKESLNRIALYNQCLFFKLKIRSNARVALMGEPMDVNPLTKLWEKLSTNTSTCEPPV